MSEVVELHLGSSTTYLLWLAQLEAFQFWTILVTIESSSVSAIESYTVGNDIFKILMLSKILGDLSEIRISRFFFLI